MKRLNSKTKVTLAILLISLVLTLITCLPASPFSMSLRNSTIDGIELPLAVEKKFGENPGFLGDSNICTKDDQNYGYGWPLTVQRHRGSSSCPDITYYPVGYVLNFTFYGLVALSFYLIFSGLFSINKRKKQ